VSTDGGTSFGPIKFEPQLVNAGGVDGSVVTRIAVGGAPTKTVFYSHPDSAGRANMTLYTSLDDAATWAATLEVYGGASAYSSMAMLPLPTTPTTRQSSVSTAATACRVGLAFEKDGYKSIAFAAITTAC
jgi:hypothetical protein